MQPGDDDDTLLQLEPVLLRLLRILRRVAVEQHLPPRGFRRQTHSSKEFLPVQEESDLAPLVPKSGFRGRVLGDKQLAFDPTGPVTNLDDRVATVGARKESAGEPNYRVARDGLKSGGLSGGRARRAGC
eukprot:1195112-Prorocentrum_minimum.AAC.5